MKKLLKQIRDVEERLKSLKSGTEETKELTLFLDSTERKIDLLFHLIDDIENFSFVTVSGELKIKFTNINTSEVYKALDKKLKTRKELGLF